VKTVLPSPEYTTPLGAAYLGDSFELIQSIPDSSVNLIMTSPPFGLVRKKEYGNVDSGDYVGWFLPLAEEFRRILTDDGSAVIDLGGSWNKGTPTRSLYVFELLIALCNKLGFHLAQESYWYNPAKLPRRTRGQNHAIEFGSKQFQIAGYHQPITWPAISEVNAHEMLLPRGRFCALRYKRHPEVPVEQISPAVRDREMRHLPAFSQ
jgi:DNA methylase